MFEKFFKKKPPGLEEQLEQLRACGVRLLPAATPEALLEAWSQADFDAAPFLLAATALGGDSPPLSENLWHFDTECIEDHGAYVAIAERFRDLANGDLPLVAIEDYVDVEEGEAWLAFTLEGTEHRWTCEVSDDWVDPTLMTRFAELLAGRRTAHRFTYLDTGGQDCIIGCFTEDELKRLQKATGLEWKWLA